MYVCAGPLLIGTGAPEESVKIAGAAAATVTVVDALCPLLSTISAALGGVP